MLINKKIFFSAIFVFLLSGSIAFNTKAIIFNFFYNIEHDLFYKNFFISIDDSLFKDNDNFMQSSFVFPALLYAKEYDSAKDGVVNAALRPYTQESYWYKFWTKVAQLFQVKINHEPLCNQEWQRKFCDKSMMCYATQCFYKNIDIETLHTSFLQNLIAYLTYADNKNDQASIAHFQKILQFGIPQDNKKHVFMFDDSAKNSCSYSLWKKEEGHLEFNLTGCIGTTKQEMLRTLIAKENGVLELYHHIAY